MKIDMTRKTISPPGQSHMKIFIIACLLRYKIYIYLGQYKPGQSWQTVVFWARRNIEPAIPKEYNLLFEQNLIKIIYLTILLIS